jgi:hypothetical protein
MIGWWDDACFNVFVDYAPETGDWMLIHRGHCAWFLVEVPHNCEVPTNVRRNMQLSRLTPIKLFDPGFRSLHLPTMMKNTFANAAMSSLGASRPFISFKC